VLVGVGVGVPVPEGVGVLVGVTEGVITGACVCFNTFIGWFNTGIHTLPLRSFSLKGFSNSAMLSCLVGYIFIP
jgi:hypothetical protein